MSRYLRVTVTAKATRCMFNRNNFAVISCLGGGTRSTECHSNYEYVKLWPVFQSSPHEGFSASSMRFRVESSRA